ncbi:MAG: hypothetical protein QOG20_125 [Pseudonocardiales bacterium]|jgi:hypothetical protein|nr:hypothetical protein [Pseudonocardiales bacterium]
MSPVVSSTVALRVLGPLGADVDGMPVDLGGPGRRAVLAGLAAAGGDVVSAARVVVGRRRSGP